MNAKKIAILRINIANLTIFDIIMGKRCEEV